jgi:hypothetical protein
MVWNVDEADGAVRLSVEIYDLVPGTRAFDEFTGGISYIVSGLKTLLETGRPLQAIA